jgi:alkylation response protein AidB-like acyl-CoA dehydrogenase
MPTQQVPTSADLVDAADAHPLVVAAKQFSREVLWPDALETDANGATPAAIDGLRRIGLLNHLAPAHYGGGGVDQATERRIHEHISYGCFNTWLAWAQHTGRSKYFTDLERKGKPIGRLGEQVLRGEILTGTAISDARHYPQRYVRATRVAGGWALDGTVSWVSGWGLNVLLSVAAIDPTTETQLLALVPVDGRLRAEPLPLIAAGGSRTERVIFDDVVVPDEDIVDSVPKSGWQQRDLKIVSDLRPQVFGVAQAILDELRAEPEPAAVEVAEVWAPRFAHYRAQAYHLTDLAEANPKGEQHYDDRLALKVEGLESLHQIARALVIARAGSAIRRDNRAQLHARSALFLQVQSQNRQSRASQLAGITAAALPAASRRAGRNQFGRSLDANESES